MNSVTSLAEPTYQSRRKDREAAHQRFAKIDRRIADVRLLLFLVMLVMGWMAFRSQTLSGAWLSVPAVCFIGLVMLHDRVSSSAQKLRRAIAFYETGLRNLEGTWQGQGRDGERFLEQDHPFAADLDLFGQGSLFERLCRARTKAGEETLASWLLTPAIAETVRARQVAVDELRSLLDLREDLEILGSEVRAGIDPQRLVAWGEAGRAFGSRSILVTAIVLAVSAISTVAGWAFFDMGTSPLALVIILEVVFVWRIKKGLDHVIAPLDRRAKDLAILAKLLARLETETFQSPLLVRLHQELSAEGATASKQIARLARLLNALDARKNQVFAPFAALLLWSTFLAMAIESWRVRTGSRIATWLVSVGEIEALLSLASYAYECPNDPFPEIEESRTCFEGVGVAHPLLTGEAISNDVSLGGETQAFLISGSNMSGKSTLLRTVGANTVLALAGGPVRASGLRVSVLSIGATLRIQDSLQQGRSRFFAELTRVRAIVELAKGDRPVLFLLDEIFHGTNSHDRVAGAGGLVRGLLDQQAIGLLTTHDLALATFADALFPRVVNKHFEDQFVDGRMTFDYRLKPGVVTHSNALALMRAVGLDV